MSSVRGKLMLFNVIQCLITAGAILAILYTMGWSLVNFLMGAAIGISLSIFLGYFPLASLSRVINILIEATDKLIKADLRIQMESKDYGWKELTRLAENIRKVTKGVNKWFGIVKEHTEHLANASEQIISGSEQVSAGSQDQAEQVQQLLFSIEEISKVSNDSVEKAKVAASVSGKAVKTAREGEEEVLKVSQGIDSISNKIEELSQRSREIVKFLKLINDVASQTNLLALNAAIEAARAGEHGRGFAVVADEVRKLAENTSGATKEINELLKNIQSSIDETVQAVATGLEQTAKVKESFRAIVELIESTEKEITSIAEASKNQAERIENMVQAVHSISTAAQEAAASSQEVTAVVQELDTLSEELKKIANMWKFA